MIKEWPRNTDPNEQFWIVFLTEKRSSENSVPHAIPLIIIVFHMKFATNVSEYTKYIKILYPTMIPSYPHLRWFYLNIYIYMCVCTYLYVHLLIYSFTYVSIYLCIYLSSVFLTEIHQRHCAKFSVIRFLAD